MPAVTDHREHWWAVRPAILGAACLTVLFLPVYTDLLRSPGAWRVALAQPPQGGAAPGPPLESPPAADPPRPLLWELSPLLAQEVDRKMDPFKGGINRSDFQQALELRHRPGWREDSGCLESLFSHLSALYLLQQEFICLAGSHLCDGAYACASPLQPASPTRFSTKLRWWTIGCMSREPR